ncbi:hypothetical protein D3C80_1349100 [compost metagenome]
MVLVVYIIAGFPDGSPASAGNAAFVISVFIRENISRGKINPLVGFDRKFQILLTGICENLNFINELE